MAYKFDENKYKRNFDQMYGKGAFDSGLSDARSIGRAKANAEFAKQAYQQRLKEQKKAAEASKYDNIFGGTASNPNAAKQIDDMIKNPKKAGAYRNAETIRNDPSLQAELKKRGYAVNKFVDSMYNAASGGKFRSEREYNQFAGELNKQNAPNRKANQESIQAKIDAEKAKPKLDYNANLTNKTMPLIPMNQDKKKSASSKKDSNWFIDSQKWLDKHLLQPAEDKAMRYATNIVDALTLNHFKDNLDGGKKIGLDAPEFVEKSASAPKTKADKTVDIAGQLTGSLLPIGGAYKATKPVAEGTLKLLTRGKDLGKVGKLLESSIKGGTAMGAYGTAREGFDELINPNDATLQERAKQVGLDAALGAIGDPAFRLAGAGLKKGSEMALNKLIKGDLPKFDGKIKNDLLDRLAPLRKENLTAKNQSQKPLNLDPFFNVKRAHNPSQPLNEFLGKLKQDSPLMQMAKKTMYEDRKLPDYSLAKPEVETPAKKLSQLLSNLDSERKMPNYSFGKQTSEPIPPVNVYGVEVPYDKVLHAPADYWQGRYEDFVNYVNKNYDHNKLNKEALEDLWTQFAHKDEPVTLEQVVDLAYPSGSEAPVLDARNVNISRESASKKAKNILGIDETAFNLPKEKTSQSINAADVWDKMGNRPSASKKSLDILLGDLKPKQKQVQQNPLQALRELGISKNPANKGQQTGNLLDALKVLPKSTDNGIQNGVPSRLSESASNGLKERGHIETLRNSQNTTESLKDRIKGMYKPTTNEEALTIANKYLAQGVEKATSFVKSAKVLKPEHVATAHRLIQELQKSGQIEKAVDIAEHIAERGTKAGQAVQAFSIFDKLSPEGILVHANRVADRVNAKLSPLQKEVKVTNETAAQLTDLASTVQKMTKQKTVANDVINIMDKAKAGQKLTPEETNQLRQFVDDAKQWITDITPKKTKPKEPNKLIHPEVKKQIVSFLDKQEEAARKRLAARKGRALSGLPVDDFYDYAVIGASKLAKGTLNFADFSEQMIREFGEEVAPHVRPIYDKALDMVNNEVKRTTQRLSEVEKITNKALKNGKLEESEAESLRKFALSINTMSGDAKIEASQELQAVLQGLERPSLLQQISATQTIGQLLNPKTLARNAIGNEMFYRLERLNKLVATPIDIARTKITGKERSVTFRINNQGEYWKNWLRGVKAGWKGVNPEGLSTQYDLHPNSFNGKWNPLKYMERALGASLKSFDYAGYKRAVNNTIGELATLRAVNEGLTGQAKKQAIEKYIREVDENVLAIADQYGKYATFQDNNIIAVGLQKFKRGLNFGKDFGLGDLIIKYPRTPGALLGRALEYSPAGFLKFAYTAAKPFFKKEFSTKNVTESFTRALIGTAGAAGMGWFLADKGILTGRGNKDFDVNDLEKTAGKGEYSLNYDALKRWVMSGFNPKEAETKQGDRFISYNWAQPVAMSVALGANAEQNVKSSGNPSFGQATVEAGNGALDSLVGMSVLQGVQKAFTSSPGQSAGDQLLNIAGGLPSSFVPTFSNQVRQKADNTARSTYDPLKLNVFKNQAKNKIPGVEKSLPPSFDTLGRKKEVYQDKSNTFFNVFLNPAFVSRYNPSPEAKMVLDVINDTGDTSVAPRRAQKYLMAGGKRYDLTPKQYSEYQRRLGTEVRTQLKGLNPNASSEEVGKEINKILDKSGRKVRNELKLKFFGITPK